MAKLRTIETQTFNSEIAKTSIFIISNRVSRRTMEVAGISEFEVLLTSTRGHLS